MSDEPTKPQQPAEPAQPTVPDAPPAPEPAADQPTAQPAADASTAAQASTAAAPPPEQPVAAQQPGRFGRFARHRATQIVAAGLAGLLIGGGAVAMIGHGDGRHGYVYYQGGCGRGPYHDYLCPNRDRGFPGGGGRRVQPPPSQAPVSPTPQPSTPQTPPSSSTPG